MLKSSGIGWFAANKKALLRWVNDRLWHRWPLLLYPMASRFRQAHGYWPNLLRPRSLNEKVLYRILFDRRAHLPMLSGKLESRAFIERRTGSTDFLVPLVGVIRQPEEIRSMALPKQFVMKPNRGSQTLYFHRGETAPDLDHLQELCRDWLGTHFAKSSREWVYNGVESAVVIEALLADELGRIPIDYKFFCFDGEPRWLRVCQDRHGPTATYTMLRTDWTVIEEDQPCEGTGLLPPPPRPPHFEQMLELARVLSRGTDMLRVDLYDTGGKVYCGELTNTPDAGRLRYFPAALDVELGEFWKLDTRTPLRD